MSPGLHSSTSRGRTIRVLLQVWVGASLVATGAYALETLGFEHAVLESLMAATCAGIVALAAATETN